VQKLVQSLTNAVGLSDAQRRGAAADKSASSATTPTPAAPVGMDPPGPPVLHPEILGTIGEEIAHHLTEALELIVQSAANPRTFGQSLSRTHFVIDRLRRKAMAMQQIARLAQNRVRQSHEKLSLQVVAQNVLDDRKAENVAAGLVVSTKFKPVDIIVDPGLLMGLISTAIDWVSEFGAVVRLSTGMKNWPQHGQLTLIAAQGVRTQEDIDRKTIVNQSIAWHLLQQIAQSMGVGLVMDETIHERSLVMEFPRTVVALEGMTMMEMESGQGNHSSHSSFGSISSNFIAGHHVLVLSSDYRLFTEVREICKGLSMRCEHAPNVQMAERQCEQQVPHLIVCEEALDDDQYAVLLHDLQRHTPGFPTIIVTDSGHGFEFSDWSGNSKSRVSRNQLQDQLASALSVELSRTL
jgi:hypothetical protein